MSGESGAWKLKWLWNETTSAALVKWGLLGHGSEMVAFPAHLPASEPRR